MIYEILGTEQFWVLVAFIVFVGLVFNPINFNNSTIVKISLTKGMFVSFASLDKIVAAKIGKVAFLDPEIEIFPDNSFFPLINNFCIQDLKS